MDAAVGDYMPMESHIDVDSNSFRTLAGDFDEWTYLFHNADVAQAVRIGKIASGEEHFTRVGLGDYRSNRRPPPPTTCEMSYLLRNLDVKNAVERGTLKSGYEHWLEFGRQEEIDGLRKPYISGASQDISGIDVSTWRDGYVIIPSLFDTATCDRIVETTQRLWRDRAAVEQPIDVDIFLNHPEARKVRLSEAPDAALDHPFKINNLYYWNPLVRSAVLDSRLCRVLRYLLDGDPVALTSLNFRKGSEQGLHLDTFYMPPAIPYRMVAAWMALEDVGESNGPLSYVPGSNRIPPFFFDDHRLRIDNSHREYEAFGTYILKKIADRGLPKTSFTPKKGDVLIWHSLLYHGGSPILDAMATRHSLVAHYFASADYPGGSCTGAHSLIEHDFGSYYEDRPPQFKRVIGPAQASFNGQVRGPANVGLR
jgi:phytanoyl-CoA hydroxylase